ncbi:MAG TPA: hypothetical protein VF770_00985, partial [Solirubrobacterales bacterium]
MALSDDQKALLRLLAQREQGYDDIGALMGVSVDEVRARVREALAELNEGGEPAAPAPKAAAAPPPPSPAPSAPEPEPERRRAPIPPARSTPPSAPRPAAVSLPRLPRPKSRRGLFELVGGIVVVLLLVLFATGVVDIGGGGGSSKAGMSAKPTVSRELASGKGVKPTQALLEPVNGGHASGRALFGRSKETVLLLVEAKGLEPSPKGRSYAISLARSPTERVPIAATEVGRSGTIAGQYQVAPEALGLLAGGFDQMEVSLVSNASLKTALTQAKRERKALSYSGAVVLRGKVTGPIV